MSDAANQIFRQLTDADLKFGTIKNEKGESIELGNSSFSALLHSPKRSGPQEGVPPILRQYFRPTRTRWPPR